MSLRKGRRVVLLVITVLVLALTGVLAWYPFHSLPLKDATVQFGISAGSSLRSATRQMAEAGVLQAALPFEILTRVLGHPKNIKAGNYEIERGITPLELVRKITRGDSMAVAITFVEGWTFRQMRKGLDDHPSLRHDTRGLSDADILQKLGIAHASAEGLFFPDTFHFSAGVSDLNILRRSHELMMKHLDAQWAERSAQVPLSNPYDALILASIIEKETGKAAERPTISAVFQNRLRLGMRLQTDPTVIYGLGETFDGNLRKQDLVTDGPYNTYTRTGMPPTPIAMPSLASLHAALHPAATDALYFVAKGDGSSHFSNTLQEHDRAVTKYQRGGRK